MKRLLVFIFVIFAAKIYSQFNEYYPEYNWLTIKGKNVEVHYHEEAERTARTVLKIADEVWGPITSLYNYEPDVVHYVIKDIDDYSNGATYFFDNKIEIWASALDFDLRGSHNWLRNVISHEFTHMVQIQASMKVGRSVPAIYLQFLNYEDRRRPDILYGFPNFIASYPLATINVPAWFAEGTAQYMRKEFDYDNWDTHRDMILRSYVLDGNMLTWNEMGVFGKTSLGNESVYNSGFALTRYISQKYGEEKLREVSEALGDLTVFTIDAAFEKVLGKDGNEIYDEWQAFLEEDYNKRIADVKNNLVVGEKIRDVGFGNFYPQFTRDGKKIGYISNKKSDYFAGSIYLYDPEKDEEITLVENVRSTFGFSPDDNKVYYSKLSEDNPNWVKIHDLYVYDIKEDESKRLTKGLRANNPSVSHDGEKIVFVYQKDGTSNLGMVDNDGSNFKRLTFFENGEQVYNPKFSPDDKTILFDYTYHHGRDVASVNADGSNFKFLIQTAADERNPVFINNNEIIYASDATGIFNLYKYDMSDAASIRITNVIGGTFMPTVNESGDISYAGYTSEGYKIFELEKSDQLPVEDSKQYVWLGNPPLEKDQPAGDIGKFQIASLKNFNDRELPDQKPEEYSGSFTRLTFFPVIRYDNYNQDASELDKIKPGLYLASTDVLNRYSLFGGASINKLFERDLFLMFEYRNKLPLLYSLGLKPQISLELYSVSRKTDVDVLFGVDSTGGAASADYQVNTDVTYNLLEVDVAAKHKIFAEGNDIELRFIWSRYTATLGSFLLPNTTILYPTTNDEYFIGRNIQLRFEHKGLLPHRDADISPLGREFSLQYNYEFNKYNPESNYEVEDGVLKPIFDNFNFHRLELNWKEHQKLFMRHSLTAQIRAATIFGPQVPDFFDFYLGGLVGMKAYPFYAVSGNELAWLNLTYRFPLFRNIDGRFGHLYIDKIYVSVYGDIGNAWNGDIPSIDQFKKGAGGELRIKLNSFYLFPTSIFINAAYAFDKFTREVRGEPVTYGKEWSFYGGILFDFSF